MPIEAEHKKEANHTEVLSAHVMPDGNLVIKLYPVWDDPAAWGLFLVDVARHAARAYQQLGQRTESEVLDRIRQGFDAEWESPTDNPQGNLVV